MATLPFMLAMLATAPAGATDVLDDEIPVTKLYDTPVVQVQYEDYDFEADEPILVLFEYKVVDGVPFWRMPGAEWTPDTTVVTNVLGDVYDLDDEHFQFMAIQAQEIAMDPTSLLPETWFDLADAYSVATGG